MKSRIAVLALCAVAFSAPLSAAPAPPATPADPLGRTTPFDTVKNFLQACVAHDYSKAANYLDLSGLPPRIRGTQGPQLARDLESVLNSSKEFNPAGLSTRPEGNLQDDSDPNIEHVVNVDINGQTSTLTLLRSTPAKGPAIWEFSPATVSELPKLVPVPSVESAIEARLPRFLVANDVWATPLWKWIALLIAAVIFFVIVRLLALTVESTLSRRLRAFAWIYAIIEPLLVIIAVATFRIFEELINPSALSRLYIGDFLTLVVVWSVAWGMVNLFDLFLQRLDTLLDPRQRVVAHSLIYLARRVGKVLIYGFAAIIILDNWGLKMTTVIAGLGVGGIAVALAAQQTIANVFGGVSVISDSPVMIGDFGNFGGVIGNVEEIGMRSSRIRTLNRTVVSIPNSAFATANLENYALRDKILFNPTIQVKRTASKENIRHCMKALHDLLAANPKVEIGPTPVRISGYSSASFALEIFAYVLTSDINEFYKHQADLYFAMDDVINASGIELA